MDPNFAYAMGTYDDLHSYQSFWYEFGDSESQWKQNLEIPDRRQKLQTLGWDVPDCIVYDINRWGFRATDVEQPVDLAVFGDSYTMGVGLPQSALWHDILGHRHQWQIANFGVAGGAARTCFRLANYWLPKIQPRHAIFVLPHSTRLEISTQTSDGYMTTPYLVSKDMGDEFLKRWWSTDFNSLLERDITVKALSKLCESLDIGYLFFQVEVFEQLFLTMDDRARDLKHGGRKFQLQIADHIDNQIKHGQWH